MIMNSGMMGGVGMASPRPPVMGNQPMPPMPPMGGAAPPGGGMGIGTIPNANMPQMNGGMFPRPMAPGAPPPGAGVMAAFGGPPQAQQGGPMGRQFALASALRRGPTP